MDEPDISAALKPNRFGVYVGYQLAAFQREAVVLEIKVPRVKRNVGRGICRKILNTASDLLGEVRETLFPKARG